MDPKLINDLLKAEESVTLDFKRDQYPFDEADDRTKSELLKDILAFANAPRETEAYILIGVEEVQGARSKPVGVAAHLDDANLQQFVNSKTNRPIAFAYEAATLEGLRIGIIRISVQQGPYFLNKDYGKLKASQVYIRRGSSTSVANPDEIHQMGAAAARKELPQVDEYLEVSLLGGPQISPPPPYGTGEPMHLEVELTIVNVGHSPVFVVAAALKDKSGSHAIPFPKVYNENEPIQPGGRRKAVQKLLYNDLFPPEPWSEFRREQLKVKNRLEFTFLRFICQEGATFQVKTARGSEFRFTAANVCNDSFPHWPFIAAPAHIEEEFAGKSLEDMERKWLLKPHESPSSLDINVLCVYYQDVSSEPYPVITSSPRRFRAELGITNVSTSPIYIKSISLTTGTQTYEQQQQAAIRIEPDEYKKVDATFAVNGIAPASSGEFKLEVFPAVGTPMEVRGSFPLRLKNR